MHWESCSAVERNPRKSSGAWAFTGTRVPVYALLESLASGATIDEFVEWFPGVDKRQVRAVLEHEAKALRRALAHSVDTVAERTGAVIEVPICVE